jgi:hypothetical protein
MRERSGRQDVPERSDPKGLARLAREASATNENGSEAETPDGSGEVRDECQQRNLRRPNGRLTADAPDLQCSDFTDAL